MCITEIGLRRRDPFFVAPQRTVVVSKMLQLDASVVVRDREDGQPVDGRPCGCFSVQVKCRSLLGSTTRCTPL
jgi:hypothetical protein